ncbi:MAG: rod shape-determining protein MreC [Planctomycetes bacterium]|nr:rod shape-determining protein MreC [Planctomycetota bacterium]
MRDSTRFAVRQALSIFLLVATLVAGIIPSDIIEKPRAVLMDAVCLAAGPLYFVTAAVLKAPSRIISRHRSTDELEKNVTRLTAELVARDSQLRRARQALEGVRSFQSSPISDIYLAWSGDLVGCIQGADTSVFSRSYVINLGGKQGVAKGDPVVWGKLAVGVISEAAERYSRVRVLGDPRSRVAIRFVRSRDQGVLVGNGQQVCPVRFVPNRSAGQIKAGDWVVTSGADQVFPPDLLVGRVSTFFARPSQPSASVTVELAIDFSRIESCLVLKKKPEVGED